MKSFTPNNWTPDDWDNLLIDAILALTGVLAALTVMAAILTLAAAWSRL